MSEVMTARRRPAADERRRPETEVTRPAEVRQALTSAPDRGVIFRRGSGPLAGDAARNTGGVALSLAGPLASGRSIRIDWESCIARAAGGVPLRTLIAELLRHGWCPASTPDDLGLTLGGSIASCAFGNGHHASGSLADQVVSFELVDGEGRLRTCEPTGDTAEHFWATVGGLGLTGAITAATIRIVPVTSAWLTTESTKCTDLDAVLATMASAAGRAGTGSRAASPGSVRPGYLWARLDPTATGSQLGRGVVTSGRPASVTELPAARQQSALDFETDQAPGASGSAVQLTSGRWRRFLPQRVVRASHDLWFRSTPAHMEGSLLSLAGALTGTGGMAAPVDSRKPDDVIEHEFAVPDCGHGALSAALAMCAAEDIPVTRAIVRRLGTRNRAPLGLPGPGWALRLRLPATDDTGRVLDAIDEVAANSGGRTHLAMDRRMNPDLLATMYPGVDEWRQRRSELD
ncbi:MAG: FAD-binding protein, partial [Actinomycetota bacterium]|nr:FAD-binding protein [Actinomycetota bacterium]